MAVALGAACDFLTPIAHQCNILVMGPGGDKFGDSWWLGLPLSVMVVGTRELIAVSRDTLRLTTTMTVLKIRLCARARVRGGRSRAWERVRKATMPPMIIPIRVWATLRSGGSLDHSSALDLSTHGDPCPTVHRGPKACYAGWAMTEKPILQDPPPAPPRRAEPAPMRRLASADLVEPLKAHRCWLERGRADGRRLHLESCDLTGVALQGALLSRAKLTRAVLKRAQLSAAQLGRANLIGVDLEDAVLDRAHLVGARLSGANLRRADLTEAQAAALEAEFADFSGARLDHADLSGADLSGVTLVGASLMGTRLCGVNLRGADLREARLRGADLQRAKLGGADLRGADLAGANLRGAYLRLTRLDEANFSGADVTDAAWLTQAQLGRSRLDEAVRRPADRPPLHSDKAGRPAGAHGDE
jgi:uncharacterized protein YjbI with pentapeptide repeats